MSNTKSDIKMTPGGKPARGVRSTAVAELAAKVLRTASASPPRAGDLPFYNEPRHGDGVPAPVSALREAASDRAACARYNGSIPVVIRTRSAGCPGHSAMAR